MIVVTGCRFLSFLIPFFLLSLPLSLSTFPLQCSSLQAHIFILCFFVLSPVQLFGQWMRASPELLTDAHTLLCPCEFLKHPSLAKLHLLPEEAADKNSSFWRIVLGAAGYSRWNSFIYWKQDSRGWDLIKATKNKSKSQVWTNCTQGTTCPPWGCLEYVVTQWRWTLAHFTSRLAPASSHRSCITARTKSQIFSPSDYNRRQWCFRVYNNTGFTVSHLSTWCESFNSLCFEWLWKLSKVTKVTVWAHVPLEQAHITPEVSKGEEKTPSSPRVILINSPILIKHWLAAN